MLGPQRRLVGRSYPFENAGHLRGLGPTQPDTKAAARSAWPEVRRSGASLHLLHRRSRISVTIVQEMPAQRPNNRRRSRSFSGGKDFSILESPLSAKRAKGSDPAARMLDIPIINAKTSGTDSLAVVCTELGSR